MTCSRSSNSCSVLQTLISFRNHQLITERLGFIHYLHPSVRLWWKRHNTAYKGGLTWRSHDNSHNSSLWMCVGGWCRSDFFFLHTKSIPIPFYHTALNFTYFYIIVQISTTNNLKLFSLIFLRKMSFQINFFN